MEWRVVSRCGRCDLTTLADYLGKCSDDIEVGICCVQAILNQAVQHRAPKGLTFLERQQTSSARVSHGSASWRRGNTQKRNNIPPIPFSLLTLRMALCAGSAMMTSKYLKVESCEQANRRHAHFVRVCVHVRVCIHAHARVCVCSHVCAHVCVLVHVHERAGWTACACVRGACRVHWMGCVSICVCT